MEKYNDKRVKDMLSSPDVPEKLRPENIKLMLDEEKENGENLIKIKEKKGTRKPYIRVVAGLAACAMLTVIGTKLLDSKNKLTESEDLISSTSIKKEKTSETKDNNSERQLVKTASYTAGAEDYSVIYNFLKDNCVGYDDYMYACGDIALENAVEEDGAFTSADNTLNDEYSQTYNQEEGVIESDKALTDGKKIYRLNNDHINIVAVENGQFIETDYIYPESDISIDNIENLSINLQSMYLVEDKLVVISNAYNEVEYSYYEDSWDDVMPEVVAYDYKECTVISVYDVSEDITCLGTYTQDGYYNDVRMIDGYIYLITNDYNYRYADLEPTEESEDIVDFQKYIPSYYENGTRCFVQPEDILLPEACTLYDINYVNIGSININAENPAECLDVKSLVGYTGSIYCSTGNLYTAVYKYDDVQKTEITRIELLDGNITPSANGSVDGYIKDQFSMSEYNGVFRIATTRSYTDESDEENNYVYTLDMDLNVIGSIGDFGIGEIIKSVNFNGDLVYVVTFMQTDPLYAIDLSDPSNPIILDEFKISGYSSYMQNWNENLMIGFGIEADEDGSQTGVKLVMFDVSDPNELNEVGKVAILSSYGDYSMEDVFSGLVAFEDYRIEEVYSGAIYDRKQLLISPEKNIIGVPIVRYRNGSELYQYIFYSYENGAFIEKCTVEREYIYNNDYYYGIEFDRALYIGNYIYVVGYNEIVSISMNDFVEVATCSFE